MEIAATYPYIATPIAFSNDFLDRRLELLGFSDKGVLFRKLLDERWSSLKSEINTGGYKATTGFSERYLAQYLKKNSKLTITTGANIRYSSNVSNEVSEESHPRDDKRNFFYPDIIAIDQSSRLIFDIEIDEPYSFAQNEPIHYVCHLEETEEYQYMKREHFRNLCLTAKGMVVVRFAEEQVIKYPQSCLDVISKICEFVHWYSGEEEWNADQLLSTWTNNMKVQKWSIEEAWEMIRKNHRQGYLREVADVATFVKENTKAHEEAKWAPKATFSQADIDKAVAKSMETFMAKYLNKFPLPPITTAETEPKSDSKLAAFLRKFGKNVNEVSKQS